VALFSIWYLIRWRLTEHSLRTTFQGSFGKYSDMGRDVSRDDGDESVRGVGGGGEDEGAQ
jgi:hypothetical protein